MSFLGTVALTRADTTWELTLDEQTACESPVSCWHGEGDPSTWLAVEVFQAIRRKYTAIPIDAAEKLTGLALQVPRNQVTSLIDAHVAYMRVHDGDDTYDVR